MPYIGKRLLQVIADKRLDEHPIFFHVFSNGGAFLYQHISLAMQRANTPFKVRTKREDEYSAETEQVPLVPLVAERLCLRAIRESL